MNPPAAFPFKIGTTFNPACVYYSAPNVPGDITNFDIESQIRNLSGTVIATLTVIKTNATQGQYTFNENTNDWPVGIALWDMKFSYGGVQFYTQTITINLVQYQTDPTL